MDNRVAKESKGASIAIMNVIGQSGPLIGTRLYPAEDAPWYVLGMATCSVFMVLVALLAFILRVILSKDNAATAAHSCDFGRSPGANMNNDDGSEELEMGTYVYDREGEGEGLMEEQGQDPGRRGHWHGHRFVESPRRDKGNFFYIL